MAETKKKIFYGYYMIAVQMLSLAVGTGLVNNSSGQFFKSLIDALGITRGELNLYKSCMTIAMVITIPQVPKIIKMIKPRTCSTVGILLVCGGWASLGLATSKYHLYISGAIIGIGLSFTATSMVTMILSNWFIKNKGSAIGTTLIGSAIGSLFMNPLCANLILNYGYQNAYKISALICLIGSLPYLLAYVFKPEEKGLKPLGFEEHAVAAGDSVEKEIPGETYLEVRGKPKFWAVCFIAIVLNVCTIGIYTQLQLYFTDIGYAVVFAASMVGIVSLFNGFAKLVFGWLNDRIGTRANYMLAMTIFFFGILSMLFVKNQSFIYVAVVLFGLGMSTPTVITPMVTMAAMGQKDFTGIYARVSAFFFLGSTIGPPLSGFVYDATGSYSAIIIAYAVLLLISTVIGYMMLSKSSYQ